MHGLNSVYLFNHDHVGTLPESIGDLTALTYLQTYGTKFAGNLPQNLNALTNLATLKLSNYGGTMGGTIPSLVGSMTKLVELNIENVNLYGRC